MFDIVSRRFRICTRLFGIRLSTLCLYLAVGVGLVSPGCGGNIPLSEDTVFEAKRSVTPSTFEQSDSTLRETFFGDDPEIYGWHMDREGARCTVLFFGGQRFHMVLARRRIETILDRLPVNLFTFDYRGYGRSGGEASVEGLKQDALAAYDHVTDAFDTDCVIAHGHSLGTFLATWIGQERDVEAVVLEAPVVNAQRFVRELIPWYLRLFIGFDLDPAFDGEDNGKRLAEIDVPVLLVAGEEDNIAPPAHAEALKSKGPDGRTTLVRLEKGSHNNLYRQAPFASSFRDLLCDLDRCPDRDTEDSSP